MNDKVGYPVGQRGGLTGTGAPAMTSEGRGPCSARGPLRVVQAGKMLSRIH